LLSVLLQFAGAAALVAPDVETRSSVPSYCGYSFAIQLADDEIIQFVPIGKVTNYYAELRDGELKLIEHGPALHAAVKQRRISKQGNIETLQLIEAGRFAGYRIRDIGQRTDTMVTGSALSGSTRDRTLLRRFDFGAGRRGSCAVIKAVAPR